MLDSFCERHFYHRSSAFIQVIELCMWGFGCHWAGRAIGTTALMARSTGDEERGAKEPARVKRSWKLWPMVIPWGKGVTPWEEEASPWGERGPVSMVGWCGDSWECRKPRQVVLIF